MAVWKNIEGHLGIIEGGVAGTNKFNTIEGNTNAGGRKGVEWSREVRCTGLTSAAKGLNLPGLFIHPNSKRESSVPARVWVPLFLFYQTKD